MPGTRRITVSTLSRAPHSETACSPSRRRLARSVRGRGARVSSTRTPAQSPYTPLVERYTNRRGNMAPLSASAKSGAMLPRRFVYLSTSGVYGDCAGVRVDETRAPRPRTERARRRLDGEQAVSEWGARESVETVILRVPGIYAADRLPLDHLARGTPVLRREDDVYTNHIHADDLAAIVAAALHAAHASGTYNASDDSAIRMGDWLDLVADRAGLARPRRVSRAEASRVVPADLLSFMSESRRLANERLKSELGVRLRYPTVADGLASAEIAA